MVIFASGVRLIACAWGRRGGGSVGRSSSCRGTVSGQGVCDGEECIVLVSLARCCSVVA